MKRREFIRLACAVGVLAATRPRTAWAVEPHKMYRIAILHPSHPLSDLTENGRIKYYREFFHELRRLGYIEGKNLVVERYSGEGRIDHYPKLAREAAARNPDVIFVITNGMADVLKEVTSTIPIVALTADPVPSSPVQPGLVKNLARPGGNITGVSVDAGLALWEKRLQLFREVVPTISKLAIVGIKTNPEAAQMRETTEKAGIGIVGPFYMEKGTDDEYREVFATISQSGANALFVGGNAELVTKRQLIAELAAKHRLPAIFGQAHQEIADPAGLVPRRRAVVGDAIDELLVLGADAPVGARLLAAGEHRQQVGAAFDRAGFALVGTRSHVERARSGAARVAPEACI